MNNSDERDYEEEQANAREMRDHDELHTDPNSGATCAPNCPAVCQHCPAAADAAPLEHSIRCPARGARGVAAAIELPSMEQAAQAAGRGVHYDPARGVATVNPYDPAREDYYACVACGCNVLVKDQPAHNLELHSNLNSDLTSISLMDKMAAANQHGADTLSRVPTEEELDVARRHFNGPATAEPASAGDVAMYAVYFVSAGLTVMLASDPTNPRIRRMAAMAAAAKSYNEGPWRSVRPVG